MRRPNQPWYRKFTDSWCICLHGRQHVLAKGKANWKEAERAFHRLMVSEGQQPSQHDQVQVAAVFDLFLEHAQRHNSPRTYVYYRDFLQDFADRHGTVRVQDLKPFHVSRWLDAHPGWKGCRWGAISSIKRALNWAVDEGLLRDHPLRRVKKPTPRVRDRFLTQAERRKILAAVPPNDPFRDYLFALEETGCRPGEVARVTSAEVDLDLGVWTFVEHKTAAKTQRPRIVILTAEMLLLTKKLLLRVPPKTPLFRNRYGRPWRTHAIVCRFKRLRKKLKLGSGVCAYLYRHAVCTDLLESGAGLAQAAEILGHKGTDMVMRHYSKLSERREHLRQQLQRARAAGMAAAASA